jgi:hypothetical protein
MRTLSLNFRSAFNAEESGELAIFLLTIEHDDFDDPLRLSTDPTQLVTDVPLVYKTISRGDDYFYLPMSVVLPDEREGAPPRSQLRITNVTRALIEVMRSVTTPARAKLELVLGSDLDAVEVESPWLDVVAASNSAGEVFLDLSLNAMTAEAMPVDSFDPAGFPGLHSTI